MTNDDMYSKKTYDLFFELLRAGLWGDNPDSSHFQEVNWKDIADLAMQQTVTGVVADAIGRLSGDVNIPEEILNRLRSMLVKTTVCHSMLNRTISKVNNILVENDIHPILFKGQGVALNYNNPQLRICGDIDLYVGKENYVKAVSLIKQIKDKGEKSSENVKHYEATVDKCVIELHKIAEKQSNIFYDRQYQQWTIKYLLHGELLTASFNDSVIFLPPTQFNVIYVLNHFWHHFVTGGVGLRQLCDWTMLLDKHIEEVNIDLLEKELRYLGLFRTWLYIGYIAVNYLGLEKSKMPFYDDTISVKSERILKMILKEGNFGRNNPSRKNRPKGYMAGKLHSFNWEVRRYFNLASINYKEFAASFGGYISKGIFQVIHDKLRTKE